MPFRFCGRDPAWDRLRRSFGRLCSSRAGHYSHGVAAILLGRVGIAILVRRSSGGAASRAPLAPSEDGGLLSAQFPRQAVRTVVRRLVSHRTPWRRLVGSIGRRTGCREHDLVRSCATLFVNRRELGLAAPVRVAPEGVGMDGDTTGTKKRI